jgi:DNA mismatch repair protein MutS2
MTLKEKLEFDKILHYATRMCMSDMGRAWLEAAEPIFSREALERELRKTHELKLLFESGEELPIPAMPDTRETYKNLGIEDNFLLPKELLQIATALRVASQIKKFIFNRRELYPTLNSLTENIWLEKSLQYEISQIVDDMGEVRSTASDALSHIRSTLQDRRATLRRKMESLQRRYAQDSMLMEEGITIRNGRLVLGFRVEHKYQVQGFIHDFSQSGQTVFIEPAETLSLSNEIRDLEIQEAREIERILRQMAKRLRTELENLRLNQQVLSEFDAIYAKTRLAIETKSVMPFLSEETTVRLRDAYHPWLLITNTKQQKPVVPLSLDLGKEARALVISGPNAGGKSVAMKTVGLLAYMLQHGFLLPCREDSSFPIFDQLFVEIGDEQSIENDLSTFSSHLRNLKTILDEATNESLVLIDEICSGTDPDEGSAIAKAVLESLLARKAIAIVTTHQGTLKAYAHSREGVANGSMQYDVSRLLPTYQFQANLPGNSFALEMARRMGFPPHVMENAARFMGESKHALEQLISDLGRELHTARESRQRYEEDSEKLTQDKATYAQKLRQLEEERKSLRQQSLKEGKHVLAQANSLIEKVVDEIKQTHADEASIKRARREIDKKRRELAGEEAAIGQAEDAEPSDVNLQIGDKVRLVDTHTAGIIKELLDDDAVVEFGNFRMKTQVRKLEKISSKEARKAERSGVQKEAQESAARRYEIKDVSTRLDLRGLMGDEAILEIDKFIDTAITNNLSKIDIIHGKGTGALRKRVTEYLKDDKRVKSFRLGGWDEGGSGVTVVEV